MAEEFKSRKDYERKKYNDPSIKRKETETWYYIRQRLPLVKLMISDGATNAQIAEMLGVSLYTIDMYRKQYKEFNECWEVGRDIIVSRLKSKLYQKAMGIVDKDVTTVHTRKVIRTEIDPDTLCPYEVESEEQVIDNYKTNGVGEGDYKALEFMLKNLDPDEFNVQPAKEEVGIEPVQVVDDIPSNGVDSEPKLFYDDSQDKQKEDDSNDSQS